MNYNFSFAGKLLLGVELKLICKKTVINFKLTGLTLVNKLDKHLTVLFFIFIHNA